MKHLIIILALLTASIHTFAQSPRIKLNQITKDSVTGSVLISSPTDSGMVYSRDLFISYGADTVLILGGDTISGGGGLSSVLSDGVTIVGDGTTGSELTADTSVLATLRALSDSLVNYVSTTELSDSTLNIRTDIPLIISDSLLVYVSRTELSDSLALISSSVTADGVTITGDGTVGSPLKVDTATVVATKQDLDLYYLDSNPDGYTSNTGTVTSVAATAGTGISVSGSPITTSGTLTITNTAPDQTVSIAGGGINAVSGTYPSFTVTGTEVDGDASNELQTLSYNSSTNEITLSDGGGTEDLSNLDLVDSTRINATGDTAYYYQNGVLIGAGAIAGGGGGTTYNNISETVDTVYIDSYLNVDNGTLYVDSTDNRVGVNTTNLTNELNISSSTNPVLRLNSGITNGNVYLTNSSNVLGDRASLLVNAYSDGTNWFKTFNNFPVWAFQMRTYEDDFIILRADTGSSVIFDVVFQIENDGGIFAPSLGSTTGVSANVYYNASGELLEITSSQRYKTNIKDYDRGITDLMKLRPVYFQPKNSTNNNIFNTGFIAEEVEETGMVEYIDYDENGRANSIHYALMTSLLTKSIQEQQAIIESQATEIEQLKTLITELSNRLQILENN